MKVKNITAIVGLCIGIAFIANASYIQIKAHVAQVLIANAFNKQKLTAEPQQPWPWADTTILAKLSIGEHTEYVLSHASMRNLAFGPSHVSQTVLPGRHGNSVIVGHRDTHFAHLQHVKKGEIIQIDDGKRIIRYKVSELAVIDKNEVAVMNNINESVLTLITCYPFNDLTKNPDLRYVVRAIEYVI
jgi:sortase A